MILCLIQNSSRLIMAYAAVAGRQEVDPNAELKHKR